MTFAVAAEAYDRFVGRYGEGLARGLVAAAGLQTGRALDVGSGPGALTRVLADRLGPEHVCAVDPSEPFVSALRERLPGVDARVASAEALPFADGEFDAALSQLAVNFMADPEAGVAEMRRVVRPGGAVGASVWDYPGEMTLLRAFWEAAAALEPELVAARDERAVMSFDDEGELAGLWRRAGLEDVEEGELLVAASYESFDDLWAPLELGVGPAGAYVVSLDPARREALQTELHRRLGAPEGPFELSARAWYAVGTT
ncbi:MAG TPA: class I SAM-dependent methyltransferase [Gaiellaceae bacterium]|nr:class I SAM-dependent methyltransferase [Gaiellaceae bacterium]